MKRIIFFGVILLAVLGMDRYSREEKDVGPLKGAICTVFSKKMEDNKVLFGIRCDSINFKTDAKYPEEPFVLENGYVVAQRDGMYDIFFPSMKELLPEVNKSSYLCKDTYFVVEDDYYQEYVVFSEDSIVGPCSMLDIVRYDNQDFIYIKDEYGFLKLFTLNGEEFIPGQSEIREIVFVTDTLDTRVEKYLFVKTDAWIKVAGGELLDSVDVELVDSLKFSDGFQVLADGISKLFKKN